MCVTMPSVGFIVYSGHKAKGNGCQNFRQFLRLKILSRKFLSKFDVLVLSIRNKEKMRVEQSKKQEAKAQLMAEKVRQRSPSLIYSQ